MSTVAVYKSGITHKFQQKNHPSPFNNSVVSQVYAGLKRVYTVAPHRVKPLVSADIKKIIDSCKMNVLGFRDAAIFAIGFSCALRRSEICNLMVEDVAILKDKSMQVRIRKSKTDQTGQGAQIFVPRGAVIKPGCVIEDWINISGIQSGYLIRGVSRGGHVQNKKFHHSNISRIVKYYANKIGYDERCFSGHSLRSGFITSAAHSKATVDKIMEISRHVQVNTLMKYIRHQSQEDNHAGLQFL